MHDIKGVIFTLVFAAGAWFSVYALPNFIILKLYRIYGGKTTSKENTVAVRCTIWSVLFSMMWCWILWFPLLFIVIGWVSPTKHSVRFYLSMELMFSSILFCFVFLMVLFNRQAVLDDYGMTVKRTIGGKPIFVPWNHIRFVEYNTTCRWNGFVFYYSPDKYTREKFVTIHYMQSNYIKGLEYAAKRIPQDKFWVDAQKKLKKMGISLSDHHRSRRLRLKKNLT